MGLERILTPAVLLPVAAGALLSWLITHRYAVPPLDMRLRQAKRYKKTNFGDAAPSRTPGGAEDIVEHSRWRLRLNGNGTVSDLVHGLMWIQAPWGTTWSGERFAGDPIKVTWWEATTLFGEGSQLDGRGARLQSRDPGPSGHRDGYVRGSCVVSFAGYDDWRLPTASELDTIGFSSPDVPGFEHSWSPAARALRQRLFPDLADAKGAYWLWSADEQSGGVAWAVDKNWPPGDFRKKTRLRVIFVRDAAAE